MIDEQRHDLVIEYLFGSLAEDARREFEAALGSDPELQSLVDELRETTAALALSAPLQAPAPHLREKVLAMARGERAATALPAPTASRLGWLPWALAAALAVACGILVFDRRTWHDEAHQAAQEDKRLVADLQAERERATGLAEQLFIVQTQAEARAAQIASLRAELLAMRGRDALAQVRIATLSTQVATFAKAGVTVVWDPQEQRGIVKVAHLPVPAAGKDYQLWVIDPKQSAPISAGVLPVSATGDARIAFKPGQAVENAGKFAISIEQTGGVAQVAGPIIFIGE